jgi:hypothetical protein
MDRAKASGPDEPVAERQAGIQASIAGMRALSEKVGVFDCAAAIRADRDSDYGNGDDDRAGGRADE